MWYGISNGDTKGHHSSKCEGPLRDRDCDESRLAEAMLHGFLKGVCPTQLRVRNNEPNRPIHGHRQTNKEEHAREKTRLLESIWLSNDSSANDAIRHVHECALHATFWACGLQEVIGIEVVRSQGDTGCLDIRQQWYSVSRVAPPLLEGMVFIHVILFLDPFPSID
jgi:hypothetical protein